MDDLLSINQVKIYVQKFEMITCLEATTSNKFVSYNFDNTVHNQSKLQN